MNLIFNNELIFNIRVVYLKFYSVSFKFVLSTRLNKQVTLATGACPRSEQLFSHVNGYRLVGGLPPK
jgi:hypothetical protein